MRWIVDVATPSAFAACRMLTTSPSGGGSDGLKQGIFQCVRRLATRDWVNRKPYAVRWLFRFRIPAMTASG